MENFTAAAAAKDEQEGADEKETRERSTIAFPYQDLNMAITVARTIYDHSGESCDIAQLAAWMGHDNVESGTFRVKVNAARIFGLLETSRGRVTLTRLGREILTPDLEAASRVQAFLNVSLFKEMYERHKGFLLPRANAIERIMTEIGVAVKQADTARQVFYRSAGQAGFFATRNDQLVMPVTSRGETPPPAQDPPEEPGKGNKGGGGGGTPPPPELHPFITGLLQTLPPADSVWPSDDRKKWLATAESVFGLIYKEEQKALPAASTPPIPPPPPPAE